MSGEPIITYIRVSTSGQGRSGLGIEAQRNTLAQFANSERLVVAQEFVEVETGKGADALDRRPQLKAALAAARKLKPLPNRITAHATENRLLIIFIVLLRRPVNLTFQEPTEV